MNEPDRQLDRLRDECRASDAIASRLECEAAMVTASFPAAVALAIGAVLWRDQPFGMRFWPSVGPAERGVVLQRRHVVRLECQLDQLVRLGGGEPLEVGTARDCLAHELERGLLAVAAGLFVIVDDAASIESPASFIWACRGAGKPSIVVDAASGNWRAWIDAGADLVVLDGANGIGSQPCGIIAGRRDLVRVLARGWLGAAVAMRASETTVEAVRVAAEAWPEPSETRVPIATVELDKDVFRELSRFPDQPT